MIALPKADIWDTFLHTPLDAKYKNGIFSADVTLRNFGKARKDLVCSTSLIEMRLRNGERMTESEHAFFGGPRMFKRNILKYIKRKELP